MLNDNEKSIPIKRQAVVIIHGIGEQRPMDTLRNFVNTIAPNIQGSNKPKYYSKPDIDDKNYELRRLTANEHRDSYKTDYFEFYWAHLMQGTQPSDVWWWIRYLFVRPALQIPVRLRWIYFTFWSVLLLLIIVLIFFWPADSHLSTFWKSIQSVEWIKWGTSTLLSILFLSITGLFANYLGDAVRYFNPLPRNIAQRQQIRQAGIDLLERLHSTQENDQNKYDRIILVGHSLGSVIAYDLINFFWFAKHKQMPLIPLESIREAERATCNNKLVTDQDLEKYRQAQFSLWHAQYNKLNSWRISDLITLGSPLAFAGLYLAENPTVLHEKQHQREYATCPPVMETDLNGVAGFSYPPKEKQPEKILHHGAAFSCTRWTNAYFTNDFVGGPITEFGAGVKNVRLHSTINSWLPFGSHTYYWRADETTSVACLRDALQLRILLPSVDTQKHHL